MRLNMLNIFYDIYIMLDILAKFNLKIQMVVDDYGELNKLELTANHGYTKTVDFDFEKLIDLTSEGILELFDLTILIEIAFDKLNIQNDINKQKLTEFTLKSGNQFVSGYSHQIITIPQNSRIINNTPEKDPYSVISLKYL